MYVFTLRTKINASNKFVFNFQKFSVAPIYNFTGNKLFNQSDIAKHIRNPSFKPSGSRLTRTFKFASINTLEET